MSMCTDMRYSCCSMWIHFILLHQSIRSASQCCSRSSAAVLYILEAKLSRALRHKLDFRVIEQARALIENKFLIKTFDSANKQNHNWTGWRQKFDIRKIAVAVEKFEKHQTHSFGLMLWAYQSRRQRELSQQDIQFARLCGSESLTFN